MGPLAEIARARGERVSGSDLSPSPALDRLTALGVTTCVGHNAGNLGDARTVVVSTAVGAENAERVEASRRGLPVVHRADYLRGLMAESPRRIAVSGSHGKTTTTAMIAHVLAEAALEPTAVVGGKLRREGGGARIGSTGVFVAEADESDRSFLRLDPTIAVATNVDLEHLDVYRDLDDVRNAFVAFLSRVPAWGRAVVCADDPGVVGTARRAGVPSRTYGFSDDAEVRGRIVTRLTGRPVVEGEAKEGRFRFALGAPGDMNALNALGALGVALECGVAPALAARALQSFDAVGRRLEWKGTRDGVDVVDDYGHHPTEIRATLEALRLTYPGRRIVVLFQPHRYTRTQALWTDFKRAFDGASEVLLADVYAAGEAEIPGVTSARLAAEMGARAAGPAKSAEALLAGALQAGDVLVTLGAGDVVLAGEAFLRGNARRVA
jgi:UDP-N-acetylmuramate--alanine ligase